MRIPIVDTLVDRWLESTPKKINYVLEGEIEIKKGEKAGKIDVPCLLSVEDFSIQFPSGVKYIYGEDEIREESGETEFKSCPSIGIVLPDVSDIDVKIPIKMGFAFNPGGMWRITACVSAVFLFGTFMAAIEMYGSYPTSVLFLTFSVMTLLFSRLAWKTKKGIEQFEVRKVG